MDEYIDVEGKTTQEALDLAVERTGISPSNMKFEILQPGGGGIFGISFKKAKIRVFLEEEKEEKKKEIKSEKKTETASEEEKIEVLEDVETEKFVKIEEEKEEEEINEEPPRSTWARPSHKAEIPKKKIKQLTPEDLVRPAVPKDRIDVDLRDEADIRRAERRQDRRERPKRPRTRGPEITISIDRKRPEESSTKPQDIEEEHREMAEQSLKELLVFWMEETQVESGWKDGKIYLNIIGDGSGLLIGRKGQTLDAIQFVLSKIIDKKAGKHLRMVVDTENYRKRRVQSLEKTALQLAEKALNTRKGQTTGPMNPHDRRIIHITLQDDERFKTRSRGEGTYKRVLISLK